MKICGTKNTYAECSDLLGHDESQEPINLVAMIGENHRIFVLEMFNVFWIDEDSDIGLRPPGVQTGQI